jgi:hypothetical protein
MLNTKSIHLRSDEYNAYIEENKELFKSIEGDITEAEKGIIYRCALDYGLTFDEKVGARIFDRDTFDYNIIFRIKGPFTLPPHAQFNSEHGMVKVRPYIIHESATAARLKEVADDLFKKELVSSVAPIDAEYLLEALRESAFNISMEEVVKLGVGFQIIQIEFDENGHFKAIELDESHY